ncbi:MAG: potassium transporter TrkG [Eubacterium sp.]
MNRSIILYILGWILKLEGLSLLLPCLVALIYREASGWAFVLVAAVSIVLGVLITLRKPKSTVFYMREGCIATALSWILLSLVGCIPFVISGVIPSFTNALFETISGFTTTGASILPEVESLPHCMLFWRSFTHWLGGMGVLVFLLAVIQMTGGSHMNLMRAESPGQSVGKLVPRVMHTARILYVIYFALTIIEIIFLLCGKMQQYT